MSFSAAITRRISFVAVLLIVLGIFGISDHSTTKAQAAPNQNSLSVYLDNPFVQGSYVAAAAGTGVSWMNFNGDTGVGQCGAGAPTGVTITGTCRIDSVQSHGGATPDANNAAATVSGSGSNFPTTVDSLNPVIINLSEPSRYMGLWWSAGSSTNTMKFFNGSTLLLTLTTDSIMNKLGTAPTSQADWNNKNNDSAANVITSVNGEKNIKARYFGNPRFYTSTTTPTAYDAPYGYEPFVYIHLFAGGDLTFNRVELSGWGFEFDNLALSTTAQNVNQRLVFVNQIFSNHTVQFNSNASGVQGTMANQTASTSTALRNNGFNRTGYSFTGWNTEPDGVNGTAYTNSQVYDFDANVTLYAQWQPLTYAISYDSQDGTAVPDGSYATGSTVNLAAAPTRTGYTFEGWFTSRTGGTALGSTYAPPATGNITLYAQWEPVTYTVTYDTQGGTSVPDGTYATDSSITLPQAPTRSGYSFAGWFAASSGGSSLGSSYSPPGTGNITLYAQWTPNPTPTPAPTPSTVSAALASTGSSMAFLLGGFGFATVAGLLLMAHSIRSRQKHLLGGK